LPPDCETKLIHELADRRVDTACRHSSKSFADIFAVYFVGRLALVAGGWLLAHVMMLIK
jgi:hypothetical protein